MSLDWRREFVRAMVAGRDSLASLGRRFHFSRQTGYKYWRRFQAAGEGGSDLTLARPASPRVGPTGPLASVLAGVAPKVSALGTQEVACALAGAGSPVCGDLGALVAILGFDGTPPPSAAPRSSGERTALNCAALLQ